MRCSSTNLADERRVIGRMNLWSPPPPHPSKKQRKSSNRNKKKKRALMNSGYLYSNMLVVLSEISRSIRTARCPQPADAGLGGVVQNIK